MSITTTRKVIKVGTSAGVTIPANDLKRLGLTYGDDLVVRFEKPPVNSHKAEVVELTQKLIRRHKQALKNLSQR